MDPRAEASNSGEVPKPLAHTPHLKMSMTKLPNGTCYIRVAPTTAVGRCDRTPLVTNKQERPRKYGVFNADATSTSPMMPSPEVETPMMAMGSRDDGFVTPMAGFNASASMEPKVETCNANDIQNPRAYTPPPRLEMSMTKLPDGICHYQRVVPATASTRVKGRVQSVKLQGTKKQGRPRKYKRFTTASNVKNPAVPSPEVVTPVAVTRSRDDGSFDDVDSVGTVMPLTAIDALGSRLNDIMPYVINIKAGQDISSMVSSISQKGHMTVLSANGAVSQVVLRQAATLGGPITYEGRFEILQLSGLLSETGRLRVLLAGRNCQVFGGHLAGVLIAASPVEVIVGMLVADDVGSLGASSQSQ